MSVARTMCDRACAVSCARPGRWATPPSPSAVSARSQARSSAIENLNGGVGRFTRNVKNWQGGTMLLRRVGAAVVRASVGFRRVRGLTGGQRAAGAAPAAATASRSRSVSSDGCTS